MDVGGGRGRLYWMFVVIVGVGSVGCMSLIKPLFRFVFPVSISCLFLYIYSHLALHNLYSMKYFLFILINIFKEKNSFVHVQPLFFVLFVLTHSTILLFQSCLHKCINSLHIRERPQ